MIFKLWHKWLALFLVAVAPFFVLLIRGVVWGSDSFGYWAYSCGVYTSGYALHPPIFLWFVKTFVNCSLYQLVFIQFLLYLCALLAVWIIGKHYFQGEGWRLPVYLGSLTPLFILDAMRFEPEFFGWTLALISLGLIIFITDKFVQNKGI